MNLSPVPRPNAVDKAGILMAPWQAWFSALYAYVTRNQLQAFPVSALPVASANRSARYMVTDSSVTTFFSIAAGGGTSQVPVYSDGTNWRVG